jgi:hypothetical protein
MLMGILSGLFKSRDKPTNRTNGPVIHLLLCEGLRFMGSMKVGLIADDEEDLENDE